MLLSVEKVLSKMPTFFSLPKRESFWLAGFQSLADPAASKPLLDLPLSASSSVILGSFPVDTALFGRICPRDRRLCCFHSKYDPLHVTKGH